MEQSGKEIEVKPTEKKLSKEEKICIKTFYVLRSMLSYKLVFCGKTH